MFTSQDLNRSCQKVSIRMQFDVDMNLDVIFCLVSLGSHKTLCWVEISGTDSYM